MASKAAFKRLTKEYVAMQKEPPPFVWAAPDEKNILNWNYIIRGPPDSPYAGGEYYGVILFPSEYPFKPPGIKMLTPSGRFIPDKKICFSMSDFHPGSWNPAWSVATILTGLLSFMLSDELTTGSITTSVSDKQILASRSHAWNIKNKKFRDAFPDYSGPTIKDLPNMAQKELGIQTKSLPTSPISSDKRSSSSGSSSSSPSPSTLATPTTPIVPGGLAVTKGATEAGSGNKLKTKGTNVSQGSGALSWGQMMMAKWHWGLLFAIAWAISSRLTGSS